MSSKKHYEYLDVVRIIALIGVLLYHLNILKGGYLAVCIFLVLTSYLSVISANKKENFSYKEYYKNQFKRLYLPLIVIVFISIFVISLMPQIKFLNLKQETTSVLFGYNNFWQMSANIDYFKSHIDSPFMHLWYISILIQFDILFPFIYKLLSKIKDKFNKKVPIIILSILTFISSIYFVISYYTNNIMFTYYNTLSRIFSLLFGLTLGFIHIYYKPLLLENTKKEITRKIIFLSYITILLLLFIFIDSNSIFMPYSMILTSIITIRLIDYSTIDTKKLFKFSSILKFISEISYEIYLIQYPIIFIFQYVNLLYFNIPIIIILILLISYIIHFAIYNKNNKFKIYSYIILSLITVLSSLGLFKYIISKDYTNEMKLLEKKLEVNQKLIEEKQKEYELNRKSEQETLMNTIKSIESNENNLEEIISNINITGIGDSVMLGAVDNLYNTFPNGYFDAKISRTAWVVNDILVDLKSKNLLGDVVILNLGANGDCDKACKEKIINTCENRKIIWVNTTNNVKFNQSINEFAKNYDNLYVIDWDGISKNHNEYFYKDGIHLTESGRVVYTKAIYNKIYELYLQEYKNKKDEIINNFNEEINNKISFYGNGILVNAFKYIENDFKDSKFIIDENFTYDSLKENILESINNNTLTQKIVFAFDNSIVISEDEYKKLIELCKDKEIYILNINELNIDLLSSDNVTIINFYDQINKDKNILMEDGIHLTDYGNKVLNEMLKEIIK